LRGVLEQDIPGKAVISVLTVDMTPILACLSLFCGTFVQEGVALGAGAVLILRGDVFPVWVVLSLFFGVVSGDCLIYGLGALARQSNWAKRLIASVDLKRAEDWLRKHLFVAVATAHLVPWVLFPTFVALGWFKVPFRRVALTSVVFNAVYVPTALLVLTTVGKAVWPYLNDKVWVLWLIAAVAVTGLLALRLRPTSG
jgi:membrane protein DedA with SNARE-associated domain